MPYSFFLSSILHWLLHLVTSMYECHIFCLKFRSEVPFGDGYRDIIDVMCYETYVLGNTDILETLKGTMEKHDKPLADDMGHMILDMIDNGYVEDMGEDSWKEFFGKVVSVLNRVYGTELKYCLWLADYETVRDYYGEGKLEKEDIDAYEESDIILSDIGYDGKLYGYAKLPMPVEYDL